MVKKVKKKVKVKRIGNPLVKAFKLAEKLELSTGNKTLNNKIANFIRKQQIKNRDIKNPNEMKGLAMNDKQATKYIESLVNMSKKKKKKKTKSSIYLMDK